MDEEERGFVIKDKRYLDEEGDLKEEKGGEEDPKDEEKPEKPEEKIFGSSIRQDLGVFARVPLASGFLSGKYVKGSQFDNTDVRGVWQSQGDRNKAVEQIESLKAQVPDGVPMAQWALAWCLQHPAG